MVYTYGCIDIIIRRSALDRNPVINSEYLIREEKLENDYYDDDLVCIPGGMSPADAEASAKFLERRYNLTILDFSNPRDPVAKDGVVINGPFGPTTKCDWLQHAGFGWSMVRPLQDRNLGWNSEGWLAEFRKASEDRDREELHRVREKVFRNTQEIVTNGGYVINGKEIRILDPPQSIMFRRRIALGQVAKPVQGRTIKVLNEDCLATAARLADKNPLVLNMANRNNPGGGVEYGAGAQEECLFRSSNYYRALYPLRCFYPMDRDFGGTYSPDVTVFRGLESEGYPLLEKPFQVSFAAVAALNRPELTADGDYTQSCRRGMKNKIRTILNIAARYSHRVLILSAFGCGAFRNPPLLVAELFKETLGEPEYSGRFSEIYFSIKQDHNDVSDNFSSFLKVFGN